MKCEDCTWFVACGSKEGECHLEPPKLIVSDALNPELPNNYCFAQVYSDSFCSHFHSKEIVKPGGRRKPASRGK